MQRLNKLFVTTGMDGALKTLDGTTLAVLHTANVSLGADAIGYDPRSKYLYIGSGGGDAHKESGIRSANRLKVHEES